MSTLFWVLCSSGLIIYEDQYLGFRRDPVYHQLLPDLHDPLRGLSHLRCPLTGQTQCVADPD